MRRSFTLMLILLGWSINSSSFGASFDCDKATRAQEKMICSNSDLLSADAELNTAYKIALENTPNKADLKQAQLEWLKQRNECKEINCMLQSYQKRIDQLENTSANNQGAITNNTSSSNYPVWFSSDLNLEGLSNRDINNALTRNFWVTEKGSEPAAILKIEKEGTETRKLVPNNCIELQNKLEKEKTYDLRSIFIKEKTKENSEIFKDEFQDLLEDKRNQCQAIKLLKIAKPSKVSYVSKVLSDKNILYYLPAVMNPHNDFCIDKNTKMALNPKISWILQDQQDVSVKQVPQWVMGEQETPEDYLPLDFSYDFKYQDDKTIFLQANHDYGEDYKYVMKLLAKGDFIGNGTEQLLVSAKAKYYSPEISEHALYLITRNSNNQILSVVAFDNYIDKTGEEDVHGQCDIYLYKFLKEKS